MELLSVEDWAEIRRLHRAEGLPIKLIARTLGISRNTVLIRYRCSYHVASLPRPPRPTTGGELGLSILSTRPAEDVQLRGSPNHRITESPRGYATGQLIGATSDFVTVTLTFCPAG